MKHLEVIIPVAEKDMDVLLQYLPYMLENLPGQPLRIIGNQKVKEKIDGIPGLLFLDEDTICPGMTFTSIKEILASIDPGAVSRTGWYFQQFIKLGYARYTSSEAYMTWDSDTVPLQKIQMVSEDGAYLFNKKPEYHLPYFRTLERLFTPPLKKQIPESFINEHMAFDAAIVREMLQRIEENPSLAGSTFFERILRAIDPEDLPGSGFSEFETYGSYLYAYHRELLQFRSMPTIRTGVFFFGRDTTAAELKWMRKSIVSVSFDRWDKESRHSFLWRNRLYRALFPAASVEKADAILRKISLLLHGRKESP